MSIHDSLQSSNTMPSAKRRLSGMAIAGIGCGVSLLLMMIAVGVGAWWLKGKARQVGADIAVSMMKGTLSDFDIPEGQLDPEQATRWLWIVAKIGAGTCS